MRTLIADMADELEALNARVGAFDVEIKELTQSDPAMRLGLVPRQVSTKRSNIIQALPQFRPSCSIIFLAVLLTSSAKSRIRGRLRASRG